MTTMSAQQQCQQQQLCVSRPCVCCLRLHFLSSDRVRLTGALIQRRNRQTRTQFISGVPVGFTTLVQRQCLQAKTHKATCHAANATRSHRSVPRALVFSQGVVRVGVGGVLPSFCMGNPQRRAHMAHCLTKASTCRRVNVMLALKGPGMYDCYGGGHRGGSPPFKQRREKKWKKTRWASVN